MLAMLPVLLALGNWQARRYSESTAKIENYRQQHDELPALQTLDAEGDRNKALHFRRVALTGKLDIAHAQLLTARYKFGQRGFSVAVPFAVSAGKYPKVLVLLGWAPEARIDQWLEVLQREPPKLVRGRLQFVNMLNRDEQPVNVRKERKVWMFPNPAAIARSVPDLDPDLLVEAGEQASGEFVDPTKWPVNGYDFPVHPLPTKHVEYSVTWFGAALALIGVWIALSLRRKEDSQKSNTVATGQSI